MARGNPSDTISKGTIVGSFELTVDHGRSVEEMVKAGNYTWANPDITDEHFPHPREGEETVIIDLVKFDKSPTTAGPERQLVAYGDLAEVDDMLTLGVRHPDQQYQYPIVFLGSVWVSSGRIRCRSVAYLGGDELGRDCRLVLVGSDSPWPPHFVFAVRRRKAA